MCGARIGRISHVVPNVWCHVVPWCQDSPKIRGHRGQGQMMAAILDLLR